MKTLKFLLGLFIIFAFISCNNRTDKNGYDGDRMELGDENEFDNDPNNLQPTDPLNTNTQGDNTSMNGTATRSVTSQDMAAMYREVDMTPQQIQEFENNNKKYRDAQGNTQFDTNTDMDNSLRDILSAEQYQKYEGWRNNRSQNTNTNNNTNTNTGTGTGNNTGNNTGTNRNTPQIP